MRFFLIFLSLFLIFSCSSTKKTHSYDTVDEALKARRKEIRNCYKLGYKPMKELKGKVIVSIKIGPGGNVADAQIQQSTLKDPKVEECILDIVKTTDYPMPEDKGTTYETSYPFSLNPN